MSKKAQVPLPKRPAPPTVDQIHDDLKNIPESDPLFSIFKNSETDDITEDTAEKKNEINKIYKDAFHFIELHHNLKEVPENLELLRNSMESAGKELKESLQLMKGQANLPSKKS
ncbi:unnamed protein product [Owenia fusiformis]|uniref:Uncharacterized protein n=1 Tax=Owenia fusiformis TaxID=6347 RepID=A0A8J1U3I2_OWEFU|nr:unnamed protein product [Owenia fusiformis]